MAADPQLRTIVQRMIDAGEPEENIASVIRSYKTAPETSTAPLRPSLSPVFESGQEPLIQRLQQLASRVSLANPERPQIVPELQPLGRLAELADRLMPFLVPTTQAAGAAVPEAAGAVGRAGKAVGGAALDVNPDLVGLLSPRLANAVRIAQRARKAVGPSEEATSPAESVSGGTPPPSGPHPSEVPVSASQGAPLAPYEEAIARAKAAEKGKSPQQLLNEEALARRRAEYQARQGQTPAQTPSPQKPTMDAQETLVYLRLRAMGKTDQEAQVAIEQARALKDRLGLPTPTAAQKRFPKGFRGKSQPPRDDE
jgi:hypothetical protein